jgi:hypothetical protein
MKSEKWLKNYRLKNMALSGQLTRPHTKLHRGDLLVEIRTHPHTKPHRGDLLVEIRTPPHTKPHRGDLLVEIRTPPHTKPHRGDLLVEIRTDSPYKDKSLCSLWLKNNHEGHEECTKHTKAFLVSFV